MSLPFSSLRVAGGFVFLAGQRGFDADHKLVNGGVAAETAGGVAAFAIDPAGRTR